MKRSGSTRRWVSMGLGVVLFCGAETARADEATAASALAAAAAARVRQGDGRVALNLLEEAHALSPQRPYLLQIGELYDGFAAAGDPRDVRLAILYLERFLEGEGATPARADVEARLSRLRTWRSTRRAPPQARAPSAVPVQVLAYPGSQPYDVTIGAQSCTTPCVLTVPPGPATLTATGAGELAFQLVVPPTPAQIRLQHPDDEGHTIGAALVPVGIAVAAGMWAVGLACANDSNSGCSTANFIIWPVVGVSTMITGIVLLVRGRQPPAPDANRVELLGLADAPVRLTSFGLAPLLRDRSGQGSQTTGASAALSFSF